MKLPECAPSTSDRASTREELFDVLELLGGFDEPQDAKFAQTSELLASLEAESAVSPVEILDAVATSEEQFLLEMGAFHSLLEKKAERIN
jgi:hypothetical protein